MYNEKAKQEFLELQKQKGMSSSAVGRYRTIFNKSESWEEKWQKDLNEFNKEQIMSVFSSWGDITFHNARNSLGNIKRYIEHTNLENFYNIKSLESNELLPIFKNPEPQKRITAPIKKNSDRKIVSLYEIKKIVNILQDAREKFMVYGLFCGIKGGFNVELFASGMDGSDPVKGTLWLASIENGKINKKGRLFQADHELFSYAQEASETLVTYTIEKSGRPARARRLNENEDLIIKREEKSKNATVESSKVTWNNTIRGVLNKYDETRGIKPDEIYFSGLIYSLKNQALQEGKTDFADVGELEGYAEIARRYGRSDDLHNLRRSLKGYL